MDNEKILRAMRANNIPAAKSGLWEVSKLTLTRSSVHRLEHSDELINMPPGRYTFLRRLTSATINRLYPGEVVMEDSRHELSTHLEFVRQAHGRVLIGGLGLGCVIRGLLRSPVVEHITCIENSPDVLRLVAPYMPKRRLTIVEADMLAWSRTNAEKFDCGWYDLWTNTEAGEPHLDLWHTEIITNLTKSRTVKRQGAWAFNKQGKELLIRKGFPWIG